MSIQAVEAVKLSALTGTTRLVAYELATYADKGGGSIFPAVSTVAQSLGVGRRTVQRHLTLLLDYHVLEAVGKSRKGVNRYRFSQAFMNTSLVRHGDAQTVVDHDDTSGGSFLHGKSAKMTQVVDHGGTSLMDHDDARSLLTHQLTPQLITASEKTPRQARETIRNFCNVAGVIDVVSKARGNDYDTKNLSAFTLQCVEAAGGWWTLRQLAPEQIGVKLHAARKTLLGQVSA